MPAQTRPNPMQKSGGLRHTGVWESGRGCENQARLALGCAEISGNMHESGGTLG